ncbi:MAG TPA: GNAT family N-acetyltransferase [Steroidobacteraceae bacterium]|nr:GNAT family N-acetyltransferase [Steroidobacteraceae bacterium]
MTQPTGTRLRTAVAVDAAQLADFAARTFCETFAAGNTAEDMRRHLETTFSPEKQRRELEDPSMLTLVLEDATGRWAGFAQLRGGRISDGVPRENAIELYRFYIDRPWHGRGLATDLMNAVKQRARERGAAGIWLGVWESNARAQAFYRKHGFSKVGQQVFVVGSDPQTDHVMWCPLT